MQLLARARALDTESALLKRQAQRYLDLVNTVLGVGRVEGEGEEEEEEEGREGEGEGEGEREGRGEGGSLRRSPRHHASPMPRPRRGELKTTRGLPLPSWNEGIPPNRIPKLQPGSNKYTCLEPNCTFEGSSNMDSQGPL